MRQREVYPNAPIVLVAVEVRHSLCDPLDPSGVSQINAVLSERLPLRGEIQGVTVTFQPGAPSPAPAPAPTVFPRWSSRDKRTAVTFRPDALVVESTNYQQYENLRGLLELAIGARALTSGAAGVERIGLRYIDEIRVPTDNGSATTTWSQWVDQSLLGPAVASDESMGLVLNEHQGVAVFLDESNTGRALALRYGPREGYAIGSTPELRRPTPAPGPFFLLDIDSFWQPSDALPALEPEEVLNKVDELHMPVREMFESLIAEKLRKEVLRG